MSRRDLVDAARELSRGTGRFCSACSTPAACSEEGTCWELDRLAGEYGNHDADEERRPEGER